MGSAISRCGVGWGDGFSVSAALRTSAFRLRSASATTSRSRPPDPGENLTPSRLEHDCLQRNSHRIGTAFTGQPLGNRIDDPLRVDAATRTYLVDQRVAVDERPRIGRNIRDHLVEAQHRDADFAEAGSTQRVFDRIDAVVPERYLIK